MVFRAPPKKTMSLSPSLKCSTSPNLTPSGVRGNQTKQKANKLIKHGLPFCLLNPDQFIHHQPTCHAFGFAISIAGNHHGRTCLWSVQCIGWSKRQASAMDGQQNSKDDVGKGHTLQSNNILGFVSVVFFHVFSPRQITNVGTFGE